MEPTAAGVGSGLFTGAQGYAFNTLMRDRVKTQEFLGRVADSKMRQTQARKMFHEEQEALRGEDYRKDYDVSVIQPIMTAEGLTAQQRQEMLVEREREFFGRVPGAMGMVSSKREQISSWLKGDAELKATQLELGNREKKAILEGKQYDHNLDMVADRAKYDRDALAHNFEDLKRKKEAWAEQDAEKVGAIQDHLVDVFSDVSDDPVLEQTAFRIYREIEGDPTSTAVERRKRMDQFTPVLDAFSRTQAAISIHGGSLNEKKDQIDDLDKLLSSGSNGMKYRSLKEQARKELGKSQLGPADLVKVMNQGRELGWMEGEANSEMRNKLRDVAIAAGGYRRAESDMKALNEMFQDEANWKDPEKVRWMQFRANKLAKRAENQRQMEMRGLEKRQNEVAMKRAELLIQKTEADIKKVEAETGETREWALETAQSLIKTGNALVEKHEDGSYFLNIRPDVRGEVDVKALEGFFSVFESNDAKNIFGLDDDGPGTLD